MANRARLPSIWLIWLVALGPSGAIPLASADDARSRIDDSKFKGVEPPAWVLDGVAKVFLSLDDHASIQECAALGATVVHAGGPSLYYPLRRDDPESGIDANEMQRLMAGIQVAKRCGMRVVLGVSPYAPVEWVRQHPDWIRHATDDPAIQAQAKLDLASPERIAVRALPLHTPYGDYAIECLAEIMRDLQVDGFSFDGCYHHPIDFSPHEKSLYRAETGRNIPPSIDLSSEEYRLYLVWLDDKLEDWYRELGTRLAEVNPEAAIYTWTTNAGRYGHFLTVPRVMSARMNRLFHCPIQEWWLDEVNLGATVVPYFGAAYVRAVSGGRVGASEPYLMSRGNPYSTDSFPPHELTVRCLGAMTNGSFTPLAQMAGKDATYQTLREISRRAPWFKRLDQEPWGAVLVSEQTRQFYAYGNVMERWLAHALGIYRTGFEEHLPITLITELDLRPELLDRFRVLFLPNVVCLSDAQVETLRAYVERGGGLVATCETSLCDELGRQRADFALADVFGTHYRGAPKAASDRPELDANFSIVLTDDYWTKRANAGAFRLADFSDSIFATDARLLKIVPHLQATYKGPLVLTSPFDSQRKPGFLFFPESSRDAFPVAAYGEFGQGRVVYFAAGIDAAYFSYGFPYQRLLLARAMQWAANEPPTVSVQAPMCVQSTFWRQESGRRIMHLWNGMNSSGGHGAQEVEVPLREETIPIHGIQLRVRDAFVGNVFCEPDHVAVQATLVDGEWQMTLPPLNIHMAVVMETEPQVD